MGHEKHERKMVAQPVHTVNVRIAKCEKCHAELPNEAGRLVKVNQITEFPPAKAQVIEVRQYETVCPDCGHVQVAEVWVSDCYGAQLKAPAKNRQLCLAHQIRNLQAAVDAVPTLTWPRAMQMLFRYAIHLHHQRDQLSPDQFAAQVARIERHCDRLLQRSLAPPDAKRLQKRYRKHRDKIG